MSAKELVEAATRMKKRGVGGFTSLDDIDLATDYILATVRPDDDEPVTRERLDADGWYFREDEDGWLWKEVQESSLDVDDTGATLWTGSFFTEIKSMGHLRRLVAALGE